MVGFGGEDLALRARREITALAQNKYNMTGLFKRFFIFKRVGNLKWGKHEAG